MFNVMKHHRRGTSRRNQSHRPWAARAALESLEGRMMLSGSNPNEAIDTAVTPTQLAAALVGPGVEVSNVVFAGGAGSSGTFNFTDPTVVGFAQGIVMTSGSAADVVGPNLAPDTSTSYGEPGSIGGPGDADLDALAGFPTYDAAVLEFDFVPTANQVVFQYAFASDEYPEWVNTDFNDVFAFYVNGTNHAVVRQVAGDPASLFVPVAVNNINNGNALYPDYVPARPDLFRPNYFDPNGPSPIDLEQDGITNVLTFQAPVNPGVVNHMKLAIADASDGVYDSAVFIQAGSLVSNENPVADLSVAPESGSAPLAVTAFIEGEDPNGNPLTYSVNWGDGTISNGPLNQPTDESEKTAVINHTYAAGGSYVVTLTVSNGTLAGTSTEDVKVFSVGDVIPVVTTQPTDQAAVENGTFTFGASASGTPVPTVQWQVSTDAGQSFTDIPGATGAAYTATAALADNGNQYRAVFTNSAGSATTDAATLTVSPAAPIVTLKNDTGASSSDKLTNDGTLNVSGVADGATVEYSTDGGGTWGLSFTPAEGPNTVLVRQTVAGNGGDATTFTFTLDTTPPALSPLFSKPSPFLVNETGVTASANATDVSGIFAESAGAVDTSSAGRKSLACTATDNAGNTASTDVPYTVGYGIINVLPAAGATFGPKDHIPVSFQLVDAGGLISDASAAGLLQDIHVAFDGLQWTGVKYNKKTDTFSATLRIGKPAPGAHDVLISVIVGGDEVASKDIPVLVV